jgi:glycosyltransferase involved in cell wall biosynthesis
VRVLHVTTLVSPDGAFGGPVRVAVNQTVALRARGHDAVLVAGERGHPTGAPDQLDGAPAELFPAHHLLPSTGFSGVLSLGLLRWLRKALRTTDVVHVHLGRDLVTLPAGWLALRGRVPYVVQTHGMVIPTGNPLAGPLDAVLTRRLLRGAAAVLCLNEREQAQVQSLVQQPLRLEVVGNGVPVADHVPPLPSRPEVLFCSRLAARKRPVLFAEMARDLLAHGVDASFVLVGPDEGEGAAVSRVVAEVGDADRLRWEGPLEPARTLDRMRQASLFVLPSVDEPMGMAVVEAMSVGRPVVVTSSCGLAAMVEETGCGTVVDETYDGLVEGVGSALADPARLQSQSPIALRAARERYGMQPVAQRLETLYDRAVRSRPGATVAPSTPGPAAAPARPQDAAPPAQDLPRAAG